MPLIPPRPTTYKGIKMRSRLEAGYAQWLDLAELKWEYEPQCFASEKGQYLPDFVIHDLSVSWEPAPITAYVEVKPTPFVWGDASVENDYCDQFYGLAQHINDVLLAHQPAGTVLLFETPMPEPMDVDHGQYVVTHVLEHIGGPYDDWMLDDALWCGGGSTPATLAKPCVHWDEGPWPHDWWKRST